MLKSSGYGGDDKNVHICVFEPDGQLGAKKFAKKWTEGWTSAEFFVAGGKTYLLLLKAHGFGRDGNNIHISEVLSNGDIGGNVLAKKVDEGWTHAEVYSAGGRQFLILVMRHGFDSDGKNVHIYEMTSNGHIGTRRSVDKWTEGWSTITLYPVTEETTILFCLKESGAGRDGNNVHLSSMTGDGKVGPLIKSYSWSEGWTCAKSFKAGGRSYLFFLKTGTGTVHINHLMVDGTVGEAVCRYDRDPSSYTTAFGTGSLADWGPRPWTSGWTTVEFVKLGGKPYLFCLKRQLTGNQEKRAKLYRVNPMQSVGPMVSYVAKDQATIWIGTVGSAIEGTVSYKPDSRTAQEVALDFSNAPGEYYRAGVARLSGLLEDTNYTYKVRLGGTLFGNGSFRTAPPMRRGQFTVAVVSCMDLNDDPEQAVWKHVLAQRPELLLQIGDNAYPNTTMRSMIWAEHLQQRGVEAFANAIRQVPSLATWDDHDFGPNNSGGADVEKDHRDESQGAFRELFPGLPYAADAGIYYKARWGDVDFFMLDNRYFRNRYKNGHPAFRTMLGAAQWTWLENAVATSDARFKVIASGTTIKTYATDENWEDHYPVDYSRLKALVGGHPGVFVVSGDIHKCRIEEHPLDGGRTLWEVISSGMAGQHAPEHAFATLAFDTSVEDSEKVTCRLFRQDGSERDDGKTILLSTIS